MPDDILTFDDLGEGATNFPDAVQEATLSDVGVAATPSVPADQVRYVTAVAGEAPERQSALDAVERLARDEEGF